MRPPAFVPPILGLAAGGRALLDLILPPLTLDGGRPALSAGLSGDAWGLISFIEAPVCDG